MNSEYLKAAVSLINARGLDCNSLNDESGKLATMQSQEAALVAGPNLKHQNGLPTPPSTPNGIPPNQPEGRSPPIHKSPPNCSPPTRKKKRSIQQLKLDEDLSPPSKRKKVREAVTEIMKGIGQVCEDHGETLGTVLGECCLMVGKDGQDAQETVKAVFDGVVKEKGVQKAFSKLLSEEVWVKRVQCMRVPDWTYLLFKLKSRLSDSGWQDLINLTKLGRTGVSKMIKYFFSALNAFMHFHKFIAFNYGMLFSPC